MPTERPLTPQEREELNELFVLALELVPLPEGLEDLDGAQPAVLVSGVRELVDAIREGQGPTDLESDDLATWLGALWGDELCRVADWEWVHLTFDNGLGALAVVSRDRAFACLPLHFLYGLLSTPAFDNTIALLFNMVAGGHLPASEPGCYVLLG